MVGSAEIIVQAIKEMWPLLKALQYKKPVNLSSFAFFFSSPFDSAINKTGSGFEVKLRLHIRDSIGTVLKVEDIILTRILSYRMDNIGNS